MSNLNQSKFGKFLSSKGFYIALTLCIVGAGTAAWVAIDATMNSLSTQDEKKLDSPISSMAETNSTSDWGFSSLSPAEATQEGIEVEKPQNGVAMPSPSAPAKEGTSTQPVAEVWKTKEKPSTQQPLAFSLPILSEVFNPFSNGELVKNKTLGDWRTHDGIDLKASKGTDIMACADGKIAHIYDDALWGFCMEIEHSGGLKSVYFGLDKVSVTHKEGDQVKVKDVIGKADKVPCEISLENHIHFGMKRAEKWVDPIATMGLA